jgi:hypothetical protein
MTTARASFTARTASYVLPSADADATMARLKASLGSFKLSSENVRGSFRSSLSFTKERVDTRRRSISQEMLDAAKSDDAGALSKSLDDADADVEWRDNVSRQS